MAEQNLKDKTVKGVGWSAADAFLAHGVTFLVGIVLARLLSPAEYGLIGIVTIFTSILLGFVDCGFSNALIRKQDASDSDYSTMFIVNFSMSLAMYFILFLSAPIISVFFQQSQLVSLIRVTGLLLIIQSLSIVQETILKKSIDFKTRAKASVFSAAISGIIGIWMAFVGCGVWSLVGQQLSRQTVYSLSLWIMNNWRPRCGFNINSFQYMWGFGWKLMLSGLIDRLWNHLYQVVVGKFYSPATLGQYTRSKEYASLFSSNLTNIVQRVSYPVLSQVQDNQKRLVGGYRHIIKSMMFITAIIMIFMGSIARPLIYCLIGEKWDIAADYLPLICISMSLYPLHAINLNMLQIQGRTDIFLYLEIIKKIIAIGPICLGIFVSIYWMLVGTIFTGIISFFLNSYYTGKKMGYTSWSQIKDVAPSYAIAFSISFVVYPIKYLPLNNWIILFIQLFVGILVFYALCEFLKLSEYREVKSILKKSLNKISSQFR